MIKSILKYLRGHKVALLLLIISTAGLYLRFYEIDKFLPFGYDQGRDAWVVRDIISGKLILDGPRTGIGHFHLGPLYYYLLTPFFYFSSLDPIALHYFNFLANIFNFVVIFFVIKNLFSSYQALFGVLIYATSNYFIQINRVPWNITILPGIAFLIFYCIFKILMEDYRFIFVYCLLLGLLFHVHFSGIVFLVIAPFIVLFLKNKLRAAKYFLISIPIVLIFLAPTLLYNLSANNTDYYKFRDFLHFYYIGFHLRFMLFRLSDVLIQFQPFLLEQITFLKFLLFPLFLFTVLIFEKDKRFKILELTSTLLFTSTLFIFSIYGGPISDYYFLVTLPATLTTIIYLQNQVISQFKPAVLLLILFWSIFIYQNTKSEIIKHVDQRGIYYVKNEVKKRIDQGEKLEYKEGDMSSYIYTVLKEDKKTF